MLTTPCKERATLATEEQPWSAMEATRVSRTSSSAQAPAWSLGAEEVQRCDAVGARDLEAEELSAIHVTTFFNGESVRIDGGSRAAKL